MLSGRLFGFGWRLEPAVCGGNLTELLRQKFITHQFFLDRFPPKYHR